MSPFAEETQAFFLKAMAQGYASDAEKTTIAELPGSKVIVFGENDFSLKDVYYVGDDGKSVGATTIWHRDIPVWVMSYGGRYEKWVIPFLKTCLLAAYETGKFWGGRGPHTMQESGLTYVNMVSLSHGDFTNFSGGERIHAPDGYCHGTHWYHGMLLGT